MNSNNPTPTTTPSPLSHVESASEATRTQEPKTTPTPTEETNDSNTITIEDKLVDVPLSVLVNVKTFITVMNNRGVYRPEELKNIGTIFESVNSIINREIEASRAAVKTV